MNTPNPRHLFFCFGTACVLLGVGIGFAMASQMEQWLALPGVMVPIGWFLAAGMVLVVGGLFCYLDAGGFVPKVVRQVTRREIAPSILAALPDGQPDDGLTLEFTGQPPLPPRRSSTDKPSQVLTFVDWGPDTDKRCVPEVPVETVAVGAVPAQSAGWSGRNNDEDIRIDRKELKRMATPLPEGIPVF